MTSGSQETQLGSGDPLRNLLIIIAALVQQLGGAVTISEDEVTEAKPDNVQVYQLSSPRAIIVKVED